MRFVFFFQNNYKKNDTPQQLSCSVRKTTFRNNFKSRSMNTSFPYTKLKMLRLKQQAR